ncbi:MAG: chromate efflux transporter [Oscillochloris sp.]|nr:chromate efflux transporter [Oscillochloris sp.]
MTELTEQTAPAQGSALEVGAAFARLGLTSFGGPTAHLGYFRTEFVERRGWLDDRSFADLVALCQFLPGPASSQVGIGLGVLRAGLAGGLMAWLGFTLPSALALIVAAYGVSALGAVADLDLLRGLLIVAVAVVANALWGMARNLAPDGVRATIAILSAMIMLALPFGPTQIAIIVAAAVYGWYALRTTAPPAGNFRVPFGRNFAIGCWIVFFGLLIGLPLLRQIFPGQALALFDSFYRAGALVFGGGHVVLPLLQAEVVPTGWLSESAFIAGYGLAQAVPGPLFTFAAYLGAVQSPEPNGVVGGLIALAAIFLPAWLLVLGALPFWAELRARTDAQGALRGVNAAVVGILLAALYNPVWTSAIDAPIDLALALGCFGLLHFWKVAPWLVVLIGGIAGGALSWFGL